MLNREQYELNVNFLIIDFAQWNINFDTDDAKREGFICVTINKETKAFYPMEFCECFFAANARKADHAKFPNGKSNLSRQAKIFVGCKTNTLSVIERYKRFTEDYPQLKKYDFDSFMKQIDGAITESRLNVELALLNNQMQTNQSMIDANEISKTTNVYIAIFTFIAAEYYCYEFLRDYISDLNPNKRMIVNYSLWILFGLGIIAILKKPLLRWLMSKLKKP